MNLKIQKNKHTIYLLNSLIFSNFLFISFWIISHVSICLKLQFLFFLNREFLSFIVWFSSFDIFMCKKLFIQHCNKIGVTYLIKLSIIFFFACYKYRIIINFKSIVIKIKQKNKFFYFFKKAEKSVTVLSQEYFRTINSLIRPFL